MREFKCSSCSHLLSVEYGTGLSGRDMSCSMCGGRLQRITEGNGPCRFEMYYAQHGTDEVPGDSNQRGCQGGNPAKPGGRCGGRKGYGQGCGQGRDRGVNSGCTEDNQSAD